MSQGRLVVACDFGTTAFRALVSEETGGGELAVIAYSEEPAAGYQDGDFVDLRAGSRCIARTLRKLEKAADIDVAGFTYNISGGHLRSVWATGQVQIGPAPRAVTGEDLSRVLAQARSLVIPFDHQILASNPVEYTVDRVGGIVDPRGRIGSQLEVEAHLITGSRSVVRNLEHAIGTAGYEGVGGAVDILAVASALLSDGEKEAGILLVDVGGTATNWALFRHGRIAGNGIVPWGGQHLTTDLAHGLRVSLDRAEQVKRQRGVVLRSLEAEISPEVLFADQTPEISGGLIAAILEPRLEEIFSLVKGNLGDARALIGLGSGIVITGGGARCRGTKQLAEEVFDTAVELRYCPARLRGAERLPEGQWATVAGLSIWAAGVGVEPLGDRTDAAVAGGSVITRLKNWLGRGSGGGSEIAAESR